MRDIDNVLFSFASSCLAAGLNCTLNSESKFKSASSLMAKIDETLDALYKKPVPVYGLDVPVVATAANLRALLFQSMYAISAWEGLAELLGQAFRGDFSQVVNTTMPRVHAGSAGQPDMSTFSTYAIIVRSLLSLTICITNRRDT